MFELTLWLHLVSIVIGGAVGLWSVVGDMEVSGDEVAAASVSMSGMWVVCGVAELSLIHI